MTIKNLEVINKSSSFNPLIGVSVYNDGRYFTFNSGSVLVENDNSSSTKIGGDAYGVEIESNNQKVVLDNLIITAKGITGADDASAWAIAVKNKSNTISGGNLTLTAQAKSAMYSQAVGIYSWENTGSSDLPGTVFNLGDVSITALSESLGNNGEAWSAGICADSETTVTTESTKMNITALSSGDSYTWAQGAISADNSNISLGNVDIQVSAISNSDLNSEATGLDSRSGAISAGDGLVTVSASGSGTVAAYGVRAGNGNQKVSLGTVEVFAQTDGGFYVEAIAVLAKSGEVDIAGGSLYAASEKGYVAGIHANSGAIVTAGSEGQQIAIQAEGVEAVGITARSGAAIALKGNVQISAPYAIQDAGTVTSYGTTVLLGSMEKFTGVNNVIGKVSIGLTSDEAKEALNSTENSVLVVKAGSTLYGINIVGSEASGPSGTTGSSLTVLSDGTLAIVATDDYTEGTALVTVGTVSTESGSTVKLVNAVKIADGTTVFATTDDSTPSEYTLVTDNLLKIVENNQIVSQSASVALTGVLAPNTVNEALTASGLGAERVIALTTDTTADSAVKALNSIALMATAGVAQVVSVNASNMIADTLDQHGSLLASYSHDKSGADLWVNLNGSFSKASGYKAGSSSYGYKSDLAGATIGADYAFGNGVAAGAAFSVGTGSARGQGNGSGVKNDIDYWGVNLYGVWTTPYVNLIGNVGYLQTKNEISQSGYKGKPDVKTISVGVKAEKALQLNESITVTPHVGVRYFNVDMDSFTAGGFKYSSEKANLFQVPFGVAFNANLKTSCGAEVKPFIDVQIAPAFGDRKATNKFALASGSASDSIEARIANNAMYSAKVGVEATRGNHSFGLNYGIASGNYGRVDQALQAKYRYSF